MPKEIIGDTDGFHLKVAWGKENPTVEVGMYTPGERSLFWQLLAPYGAIVREPGSDDNRPDSNKELAALGNAVRALVSSCGEMSDATRTKGRPALPDEEVGAMLIDLLDKTAWPNESVWAHFKRHHCNDMIRIMRRARDTAFGKDE